ncbi:hypothetical protein BH09BAC1_BH09BAC1_25760 [soil metagenome]
MKTLMFGAGLLLMLGWASCKQDNVCVCFDSSNDIKYTYTYASTTREEARDLCSAAEVQLNDMDTTGEHYICTLE